MALYDTIGGTYARFRRPDPRIAAIVAEALGDADSVVNIGAGTGGYEPSDRVVIAVEPSAVMIRQRPVGAAPCLQGSAAALPLETASVDAAMAVLSAHHWPDLEQGFREMARVARKRAVLLTWVPDADPFWLTEDYFPEIVAHDRTIFPNSVELGAMLERIIGPVQMTPVPVPHDCLDGFLCSYWRRPDAYLDAEVRSAMSSFARIDATPGLTQLGEDLESGRWVDRNGHLLNLDALDVGYRIVRSEIARDKLGSRLGLRGPIHPDDPEDNERG
ncbi:MAG: class I SAM-dependent methyltransferase [Thermomicrobiales bacterium]